MIEILKQRVAVALRLIAVLLELGDGGGHLDGDLFVGDGRLERRVIGAQQPVDAGLLMLLGAHQLRQFFAQRQIHPQGGLLGTDRIRFDAVHQHDADAGEGVVVELADRFADHVLPGEALPLERRAFVLQ